MGAFGDLTALDAARRKLAVALEESEFFCIPDVDSSPTGGVLSGLSRPLSRVLGYDWTEKQITPIEAPETVRECVRHVLSSGGGIVLVRAADRFPTACEIIHAAGGRVGFPEGIAGDHFARR